MSLISLLHKFRKIEWLNKMLLKYDELKRSIVDKKIFFNSISNRENNLVWQSIYYIEMVIYNKTDEHIKFFIDNFNGNMDSVLTTHESREVQRASGICYNLILYYPEKCAEVISQMSMNQISLFIFTLMKVEC